MGKAIYLIGPRASGKSTLAQKLATILPGYVAVDTDTLFCEMSGKSIADYVATYGWQGFREEETRTLKLVAQRVRTENLVVATGGGIVLAECNRKLLAEQGWVCYLKVPESLLVERLCADPQEQLRPALGTGSVQEEVHRVLVERAALYEECANFVLCADRSINELCRSLAEKFSLSPE